MSPFPSVSQFSGKIFVRGALGYAASGPAKEVLNPADDQLICKVGWCTSKEVDDAISDAQQAFEIWRRVTAVDRSRVLQAVATAVRSYLDPLAQLLTSEQGKPLREARGEIQYAADYFEWFAGEARRAYGDVVQSDSLEKRSLVLKEPIGVVAAITPWNFPTAMLARKAAAALAAGCTIVSKPAPETPLSALALAWVCAQAGVPSGAFSVVPGEAEDVAARFFASSIVKKITFTGSTEVGKILIKKSADTVKRLTVELGGNAPFIILKDSNLSTTIEGALFAKYRNCGQACVAANRFLVHEDIAQPFINKFIEASKKLTVGPGSIESSDLGPLISDAAVTKIKSLLSDAITNGATLQLGPLPGELTTKYVPPIVLTGVTPRMKIWHEEVFGPVTAITTFTDSDDVIALANDTKHGLGAYLFGKDLGALLRISESLQFGMVGINTGSFIGVQAPFGGIKESGFGREGSRYGIDEYTNLKYVSLNLAD